MIWLRVKAVISAAISASASINMPRLPSSSIHGRHEILVEIGIAPKNIPSAIALGHPLGATGTKLMTTLLHEMERRQVRYGLQTMCEGGGQANVTILERL